MTATTAQVVAARRPRARVSLASTLLEALRAELAAAGLITWPNDKYRNDPCGFAEEALGIRLWAKQREILEAVRDHKRVSVRSGHKVSKSHTAVIIALWFYCSFEDARVVFSSVTARQVDAILWRELGKIRAKAKLPIPGDYHKLARSGFRAEDFREISGFTAREAEAVAGISGANLLYILDEASGIQNDIFEAIQGNRAGGARLVLFSNPTRTEGEFYLSQTEKALRELPDGTTCGFYRAIHVSSEETPNVIEGRDVIPGLATREWVEEMRAEHGVESAIYKVRVKGDFVLNEEGKILSVHAIMQAQLRWHVTPAAGRLHLGLDPAGPGLGGDESAFATRRGLKVIAVYTHRGLRETDHVAHVLAYLSTERRHGEPTPIVTIDREGPIGSRIYGLLRAHADKNPSDFVVLGVRASDKAGRKPLIFDRQRDELWANLADWVRDGGALPEDAKLERELHAPEWTSATNGKLKATGKSELRKALDRSPDRADAVALAVWEPSSHIATHPENELRTALVAGVRAPEPDLYDGADGIDVYASDGGGIYG